MWCLKAQKRLQGLHESEGPRNEALTKLDDGSLEPWDSMPPATKHQFFKESDDLTGNEIAAKMVQHIRLSKK